MRRLQCVWLLVCAVTANGQTFVPTISERRPLQSARLVEEKETGEARKQRWYSSIPLGRTAKPEDLAELYYFLTTPESAAITGQTFHCNGGLL